MVRRRLTKMSKIKKMIIGVLLLTITVGLSGCGRLYMPILKPGKWIWGTQIIGSGETMTIEPGTKVFMSPDVILFFIPAGETGELIIKDGGKLIAQGTKDNPIIWGEDRTGGGHIYFQETASDESIIEYCEFNEGYPITVENSTTIQYCKFNNVKTFLTQHSNSLFQYNSILNSEIYGGNVCVTGDNGINPSPSIYYNDIENGGEGIQVGFLSFPIGTPKIEYNNVKNTNEEAIYYYSDISTQTLKIENNFIINCNGKSGVDTTGEQSKNVTYTNPRTTPVSNAGCGW